MAELTDEREAMAAAYMAFCKDRAPDHNEVGFPYFEAAWQAARRTPAAEVAGSSDSSMPIIGYANVIDGKMHGGMPCRYRYNDAAVVLQSDALKAIEEALEKAAVIAERFTAKRRFAKAGVNSQPIAPCEIAAAIRSLKESP